MWVHGAGYHTQRVSTHEEVTRMLTATKKKVLYVLAVTAMVLALVGAPAGISTAFAGECESASGNCSGG